MAAPSNNERSIEQNTRHRSMSTPTKINQPPSELAHQTLKNPAEVKSVNSDFKASLVIPDNAEKVQKARLERVDTISPISDDEFSRQLKRNDSFEKNYPVDISSKVEEHALHSPIASPKKAITRTKSLGTKIFPNANENIVTNPLYKEGPIQPPVHKGPKSQTALSENEKTEKKSRKLLSFLIPRKRTDKPEPIPTSKRNDSIIPKKRVAKSLNFGVRPETPVESISASKDKLDSDPLSIIRNLDAALVPFAQWRETVQYRVYQIFFKIYESGEKKDPSALVNVIQEVLKSVENKPIKYASTFKARVDEFLSKTPHPENFAFLNIFLKISDPNDFETERKKRDKIEQQILLSLIGEKVTLLNLYKLKNGDFHKAWSEALKKLYENQKLLEKWMITSEKIPLNQSGNNFKFIDLENTIDSFRSFFDICKTTLNKRDFLYPKDFSSTFFQDNVKLGCISINGKILSLPYIHEDNQVNSDFFQFLFQELEELTNVNNTISTQKLTHLFLSKNVTEEERALIKNTLSEALTPFINSLKDIPERGLETYLDSALLKFFENDLENALAPLKQKFPHHYKSLLESIAQDKTMIDRLKCNVNAQDYSETANNWAFIITTYYVNHYSYYFLKEYIPTLLALKCASISAYAPAEFNLRQQLKRVYSLYDVKVERDEEVAHITSLDFVIDYENKIFKVTHIKPYVIQEKNPHSQNCVRFKVSWEITSDFEGKNMTGIRKTIEPYFNMGCKERFATEILDCLSNKIKDRHVPTSYRKSHSVH